MLFVQDFLYAFQAYFKQGARDLLSVVLAARNSPRLRVMITARVRITVRVKITVSVR